MHTCFFVVIEGVVAQWCNPLTRKPEQSGGVGSRRDRASPLERHERGLRIRLVLATSAIPVLGAKNCNFTFTLLL